MPPRPHMGAREELSNRACGRWKGTKSGVWILQDYSGINQLLEYCRSSGAERGEVQDWQPRQQNALVSET